MAKSYTTPWTLRAFEALPGNPFSIGTMFAVGLLIAFFVGRTIVGGAESAEPGELRIAVTQILITAYCATAYAYALVMARRTTHELSQAIPDVPDRQAIVDRAARHLKWILPVVGVASYLLIGIGVTNATTLDPAGPWHWQGWSYDVFWHRATTVAFVYWIGCFSYVVVVESARLSRMSNSIESLDLLHMQPYQPLIRQ